MRIPSLLIAAVGMVAAPVQSAETQALSPVQSWRYADYADVVLHAPIVAVATVREAIRLKDEQAVGVPAGFARFYVEAEVNTLIRGANGLANRVAYLADAPLDSRGKPPKLRKAKVILLAAPVPGRPGEVRLVARDAQLMWSAPAEATLRSIITEAVKADAPAAVTGVGHAFHVPGSLPGEGETQIFLETADGDPVSLNILRRPGQEPRWAVALSEIVDDAAEPPAHDTLLWYRLACSLPAALPDEALEGADADDAALARADYQLVREGLGPCERTRKR